MFIKGNIILYKWFKVSPIVWHIRDNVKSVLEMIAAMSLHLVPKGSKQTIPVI